MKIFIFNIDDTLKYFELKLYNEYKSSSQTGAFEILKIIIQLILNYKSMCEHEKNSFIESNNYELNEILETEIITLPTGISKKETEELIEKDKKHLDDLFNLFLYIT